MSKMYELPYQDARAYCGKCDFLKRAIQKRDDGELDLNTLGKLREKCARCRTFDTGIYKADAILGAMSAPSSRHTVVGKGRFSTVPAGVKEKIIALRRTGLSQQKIADKITGDSGYPITRRQVQLIINNELNK